MRKIEEWLYENFDKLYKDPSISASFKSSKRDKFEALEERMKDQRMKKISMKEM